MFKKRFPSLSSLGGSDGNTSFLRAARAGNLDKVLEHLKNNIDINTCNANGLNALHLASKDGHVHVVAELLRRGATVDSATKKGNTALHIASLAGQEEVVKLLLQHGASVNVQSQNGFTPLYMAAQENHDSVVKLLLSNGANQSLATEDGFTPLAVAMQQGHDKVVAVLLESDTRGKVRLPALHIAAKKDDVKAATLLLENDHNPDVTSKSGFTPLHIASHYGNEAIANLLIQKGADVNYAAKHNISPLHVAAKWGKTNMVSLLLEKGANIESKTRDGLTPLHCAARSGHEQVVDMLLERGAPISAKTKNGLAPLHMAAQGEHVDAARILLYHRAPVDEVTVDYLTALHVAAHCGHVRVAKLLLDRNADANARALNGFTPLHIACKKNRIKVVELLLKHGASISATTESGLTPLHVASFMGCMNIVIYLLQHDASPDVPTVRGETPLHLAARANQTDIIRILLRNGAQVDARAREQQTPLHIASRLGNVDIVMLLLQHGAQVDATTKDMYTALHIAAKEGQDEVAAVLIENGASLDSATKKGFTPLHLTAKYGNIKVAQLLLQKDAPVDAQGKNGVTPLHVASHYDHQNVALLLLEKGASPHATAKNGHTPLHIAARKNQMDIATTLLEYGAQADSESKAGFTPLHLSAQEGHGDMSTLLLEHKSDPNHQAKNGLTPMHLCAQEDKVNVAQILQKAGADTNAVTKAGYTPLHVASHFGQANMVRFLLENGGQVDSSTQIGYTPLHQASQQGHIHIVTLLLENNADPNAETQNGQTPLHIAQKLGYISVLDSLKAVTDEKTSPAQTVTIDEKYRVVAPEAMHETFMSDSEEEGGEDTVLSDQPYRYLTVDEMKSLGDDSLPIDVTRDERIDSNKMVQSSDSGQMPPTALEDSISPQHANVVGRTYTDGKYIPDNINIERHPQHFGKLHWKNFLVSFLVDARGGAMRGCRHSGVRIIVPAQSAAQPTRITCRYVKPQRTMHPPQLMEGEALASRVLELGPVAAKFLGPVIMEVPHFASLRGKEREIVILRSDNGETWREHTVENADEIIHDVLNECFEQEDLNQLDDLGGGRVCRFVTYDFPQYFAVVSRIRQEVHAIGPEGGMVSSTVVPQVQAVFPQGALTKKIKVGLQAQPIDPDLTAKLLGRGVATSPIVTVEPRRRKFHKAITLSMPAPKAHSQGMINQYSGSAPTLRLLCSITGGPSRAQWEDVTGSTPLTFVNDCVSFTTTVSARFWLMDCRNIADATKMATELYREAIHVPFMAKFVVFAKRVDPLEARLRVFCMTDDKEDKTLEHQEYFTEVAKSRDVEVLEGKSQFIEMAGNLIPVTKSGEQLQLPFKAFRENRLPFSVRVKDQHADTVGRALFMREPKVAKGEPPQQPICILNIVLPEDIVPDFVTSMEDGIDGRMDTAEIYKRLMPNNTYLGDLRVVDMSNLLGEDWVKLAPEIGISDMEVEEIIEEHPSSTAQQAQAMLRLYLTKKNNDRNILENGLKAINRDDIVKRCIKPAHIEHISKRHISLDGSPYEETDLMKDSESIEELVQTEDNRLKQLHEREEMKYSAEEKIIEDEESEEDETVKRSVAERRQKIEKRLSVERQIPASTQKKEIVEEITTIKRHSLIEDKKAKHEEEIMAHTPVENVIKAVDLPEPVLKLKSGNLKEGNDIDKAEFDRELKDKFKSTARDDFDDGVDSKIHYDSTVTEKTQKEVDGGVVTTTITTTKTTTIVDQEPQIVTFTATDISRDGSKRDSLQEKLLRDELERDDVMRKTTIIREKVTIEPQLAEKIETSSRFVDDLIGDAAQTVDMIKQRDLAGEYTKILTDECVKEKDKHDVIEDVCIERAAKDITLSTPPPTPELQFQRDPLDDRRGIQFQDDTTTSSVQDDASVDTEMFREDHFGSLDQVTKRKAVYWASAEDFDALSLQSSDVMDEKRPTPSDTTIPSSSDNQQQHQRRRSQQKAQFNLRFDAQEPTGDSQTTSIGTSPITNLVESPCDAPRSSRTDSPSLKLVIGRKELKTSDASAISESRLTLYGTQDVEISISSQSRISVTTTHSTSTSSSSRDSREQAAAGEQRDTPRKQKREKVFESEETFGRDGKRREESVVFSNKKSIHLYGSFDSNSESPATEHSYSHHITDTGISLTRGTFTETATSPGIQATSDNVNEKGRLALITDTALDVEVEELELTDAGLSPIQPDDQDIVNIGFQMATEEDVQFSNMATSPVEFDASSSAVDTSEAGTLTDQVILKDASSSPLDASTSLRQDLSKLKEEDILLTRRGSGDVKAKVKMLEDSVLKSSLSQSSSPKRVVVVLPKEPKEIIPKFIPSDEKTDSSNEDESAVSEEPIPPIHEMIMQIEKRIADESTSRHVTISDPRSPLKRSARSTKVQHTHEHVDEARILDDIEGQVIKPGETTATVGKAPEAEDQRRISKLIHALENNQRFDEIDSAAENRVAIEEPVCEVKLTKRTISQLTDEDTDMKPEDIPKTDPDKKHVYFSESVGTEEGKFHKKSSKTDTFHSTFKTIEFASSTHAVVDIQNIVKTTESREERDEVEKVRSIERVQTEVTETTDHEPSQKITSQVEKSEIKELTKHTEQIANQQTIKTTHQ
ncbi:ankyrin-3-like isoform X6 [Lutzomyia longipalpis]|uniref:ankyrin-3-like isoform X6 n=1 Tax=Lutzomyia longipalpis TaxID=7200 RepID=UPI0024836199|nr:ankyrin-3-like isoform X6 [Lutzomyia longipalpis]